MGQGRLEERGKEGEVRVEEVSRVGDEGVEYDEEEAVRD